MIKKLPKGITIGDGISRLKQFRTDCYEAAHMIYAKVLEVKGKEYANYSVCSMQYNYGSTNVVILRNANHAMLAFSCTEEEPFVFLDVPQLQAAFETLGYEVLSKEYLESYPTEQDIADLSKQEIKDYRYWRPSRIGEIVFNFWD